MSDQPEASTPSDGPLVVERILTNAALSVAIDDNGWVHMRVGTPNEAGVVEMVEDFIIMPSVSEIVGMHLIRNGAMASMIWSPPEPEPEPPTTV